MNTVIINSIGTANPVVSKILSDAFKIPQEYILKLLYNAPSILLQKVDTETAKKADTLLTKLGLEVKVAPENETLNVDTNSVDISVYFDDILKLPLVINQLSEFLGCKESEVLNLLTNQSSIILGGVSIATAKALQKRIDATVYFSNPKKDLYSIQINTDLPKNTFDQIKSDLDKEEIVVDESIKLFENISYKESQRIWRKFQSNKEITIINQTHQLVNVILTSFDVSNTKHCTILNDVVGIPKEILMELHTALPITLFDRISNKKALELVYKLNIKGLNCVIEKDFKAESKIEITAISNLEKTRKILSPFMEEKELPNANNWVSKTAFPKLIAHYLTAQLEQVDCQIEQV